MYFAVFERMIAWRYLCSRRQGGGGSVMAIFSFLGIFLGVATLIVVMSVMNGFRHELLDRILGFNGHLTIFISPVSDDTGEILQKKISQISGVVAAHPMVERQVMVTAGPHTQAAVVRGLFPEDLQTRPLIANKIIDGALPLEPLGIAIGVHCAKQMGVRVGDCLTLIAPQGRVTAVGLLPRSRTFRVGAIFEMGMHHYDSHFIFLPIQTAQSFFQMGKRISALEIFLKTPNNMQGPADSIQTCLQGERAHLFDWKQANSNFFEAMQVERNVMFLILTLMIVIAVFNIISSLLMLVKNKTRDVAILRTMGASTGMVLRIFFLTGLSIGTFGALAGVLVGVILVTNLKRIQILIEFLTGNQLFQGPIYFLSHIPARVELSDIIWVLVLAFSFTFLSVIYPAWRASRLNPVEALRYE